jgi:hypothetical protein
MHDARDTIGLLLPRGRGVSALDGNGLIPFRKAELIRFAKMAERWVGTIAVGFVPPKSNDVLRDRFIDFIGKSEINLFCKNAALARAASHKSDGK